MPDKIEYPSNLSITNYDVTTSRDNAESSNTYLRLALRQQCRHVTVLVDVQQEVLLLQLWVDVNTAKLPLILELANFHRELLVIEFLGKFPRPVNLTFQIGILFHKALLVF